MADKSKNKKGQTKCKPQKGKERNSTSDSTDTKKPQGKIENKHDPVPFSQPRTEKKPDEPPIDTVAMFANLKRETDEILVITESAKSKYAKREIRSNWTKYELPVDNYEIIDNSSHGADFEELLQMPISVGGHFQFKHEKTWISDKKQSESGNTFTLNMNYISNGLSCIPFYERNRLDPSLFSAQQLDRMKNVANKNMTKFKKNLPIEKPENEISKKLLKKLKGASDKETSISEVKSQPNIQNECDQNDDEGIEDFLNVKLNENDEPHIEEELDEAETVPSRNPSESNSETNIISSTKDPECFKNSLLDKLSIMDDDNELDELLGMTTSTANMRIANTLQTASLDKASISKSEPVMGSNDSVPETKVDLDKWLDEYLDT